MKSKFRRLSIIIGVLWGVSALTPAFAQWQTQTIPLQPGWNAVFLRVQPEPYDCDSVFQGLPVESVWAWNYRFSSVQFIQDTATLMPEQPEWLTYFPPGSEKAILSDLFVLTGGQAYLIKLGGTQPVNWAIKGRPVWRPIDWLADSFNLVGFYVTAVAPPTFQSYFAFSPAHIGKPIYRLNGAGEWEIITSPSATTIDPNAAYWVYCEGASAYQGPMTVAWEQGDGLDYSRTLTEQTLRIKNNTLAALQISLAPLSSETPPAAAPDLAGDVLLSYWDWQQTPPDWVDLTSPLQQAIAPGEELALRLAVRRADMPGSATTLYQSLLEITDDAGMTYFVPVVAKGLTSYTAAPQSAGPLDDPPHPRAGLWVGSAAINKVSFPSDPSEPTVPKPTASEFQFRLIVHVDALGQASLLQNVYLMWQDGTMQLDPQDPTKLIVDQPGRFVLVTREDLLSQFSGAAVRDGQQIGRRISSAAFSFADPVAMAGSFNGTLTSDAISVGHNDPLNPFKHKYHPHHDNLDYDFQTPHAEGVEAYTVVRNIELQSTPTDPDGRSTAGWGDNQVGGIYRESIQGIHKDTLYVEGTYRLHHVSRVAVLNDGL